MTILKSDFLNIVKERGFFHQCTDLEGLDKILAEQKPVTAYIGFDCTAPSLHVGNLMQIMILRWLQKCGHRPIVLMGGGTTKIGDPSGKDKSREMLGYDIIIRNMESIKGNFQPFFRFGTAPTDALMLDNDQWLGNLSMAFVMGTLGPLISVNTMLTKDSIRNRLERHQHLSFLEFNYMVLQAYDFVKLYEDYHCRLQIGGSDQWGNITAGIDLQQKMQEKQNKKEAVFGLTTPLITTASGSKMGKTASGAVWLDADMLAPFDYWQFWRNTDDKDVKKFLLLFTDMDIKEIEKMDFAGAGINDAKKTLASEATKLCHGDTAAQAAAETARKTFEQGGTGDDLKTVLIERAMLNAGIPAFELLHLVEMKESKGEARKLIEGGGARINDEKITDPRMPVTLSHMTPEGYIKISVGKKQHLLVKVKG
jgi:tyrosyl-tRNA synthetase